MTSDVLDDLRSWGTADLNALEAVMWRAEVDPKLSSTVCVLEELDVTPEWDRFYAAHDWGSRMVARFREKVVDGPLGLGQPTWVHDDAFDLDYHVRRTALPDGAGWTELLELTAREASRPFDRTRPPWEATLVEGLPDGRAAYILKMHHATLDGMAGIQLLGGLHSRRREPTPKKDVPPVRIADPAAASSLHPVRRQARRDVEALAGAVRAAPGRLLSLGRPDHALRDAVDYAQSLSRVLGDTGAVPSPLLAQRNSQWRFQAYDVPFAPLRAASKAAGATLNDAFIAAVLGGFRRYHEELGHPVSEIPIAMPVSVRKPDDPAGGNKFAAARLSGPVGITDPAERMRVVGERVRSARSERALNGVGAMAPALARLPGPVIAQLAGALTAANDLQCSNVPGIKGDAYLAGARVERFYGYAPLPGCAAMIVLMSHGDTCCISVNHDAAAITDPALLGRCIVEGFAEVIALVPDADTTGLRQRA